MKISNILLIATLALSACSQPGQENSEGTSDINPQGFIKVYPLHDTINIGDIQQVVIEYDSSYLSRFGESPIAKGAPLLDWTDEYKLQEPYIRGFYHTDQLFDTVQNAIYNVTFSNSFTFKINEQKDTTVIIPHTYLVTNLEASPRSEGRLVNGKKEGLWKFWADNNRTKLTEVSEWSKGKRNGKREVYWGNGNLQSISYHKDHYVHGQLINYSSSGAQVDTLYFEMGKNINLPPTTE
jgi:hypothetical protein